MPNYCDNYVSVYNMSEEFKQFLKENGLSFSKISPPQYPEGFTPGMNYKSDYYGGENANLMSRVIDAQSAAWSTKWDLSDEEAREVADDLINDRSTFFETAWGPPMEVFTKLSKMFPEAIFKIVYACLPHDAAGYLTYQNGEEEEICVDTDNREEMTKFLEEELGWEDDAIADYFGDYEDYEDDEDDEDDEDEEEDEGECEVIVVDGCAPY